LIKQPTKSVDRFYNPFPAFCFGLLSIECSSKNSKSDRLIADEFASMCIRLDPKLSIKLGAVKPRTSGISIINFAGLFVFFVRFDI